MAKKKKKTFARTGFALGFTVVALIAVVVWNKERELKDKLADYEAAKVQIEAQIKTEEERKESIEEQKKYMDTMQFVEDVAKEKLGLVYEDEIIFKSTK